MTRFSNLTYPPLILAPMMDITGKPFRDLIRSYGGCSLFYSEMLNAKRITTETLGNPLYHGFEEEINLVIQLLGNDPEAMKKAVAYLERYQPFGYDLNLGCSRGAIMACGWGAGLCRQFEQSRKVINAIRSSTERYFSVKIRNVWTDDKQAKQFMEMLINEGVDAIVVHPRTTEKIFTRPAKWEWIKKVKSWVNIPIIGNGDIKSAGDVIAMQKQTNCDAMMIGRYAVANPLVFKETESLLAKKSTPEKVSKLEIFKKMVSLFGKSTIHPKRVKELRLFCKYFAEDLPVPHWFWGKIQSERDPEIIIRKSLLFLEKNDL